MAYYRIVEGKAQVGNKSHGADWIEYEGGSEPQELVDGLAFKTVDEIQQEKIQAVEATDKDMIRIAEDLVDALVSKGVIAITDLPLSAQEKFTNRKAKRSAI